LSRTNFSFFCLFLFVLYRHLVYCHWIIPKSTRPSLDLRSPSAGDFGIALNDIESNIILNHFDTNKDGAITINEFSAALGKSSTTEGGEENSKETKK